MRSNQVQLRAIKPIINRRQMTKPALLGESSGDETGSQCNAIVSKSIEVHFYDTFKALYRSAINVLHI